MQNDACTDFRCCHLIERAGHWVQEEQPEAMSRVLTDFLNSV